MAVAAREADRRNLLEHAPGEASRKLDQILERHLRSDALAQLDGLVPAPPRSGEKRMHSRQAAAVADRDAAERIKLARRRDQAAETRCARIVLVEIKRVAVAGRMRPMTDGIARNLGQVRRLVDGDLLADLGANARELFVGGKAVLCWHDALLRFCYRWMACWPRYSRSDWRPRLLRARAACRALLRD